MGYTAPRHTTVQHIHASYATTNHFPPYHNTQHTTPHHTPHTPHRITLCIRGNGRGCCFPHFPPSAASAIFRKGKRPASVLFVDLPLGETPVFVVYPPLYRSVKEHTGTGQLPPGPLELLGPAKTNPKLYEIDPKQHTQDHFWELRMLK